MSVSYSCKYRSVHPDISVTRNFAYVMNYYVSNLPPSYPPSPIFSWKGNSVQFCCMYNLVDLCEYLPGYRGASSVKTLYAHGLVHKCSYYENLYDYFAVSTILHSLSGSWWDFLERRHQDASRFLIIVHTIIRVRSRHLTRIIFFPLLCYRCRQDIYFHLSGILRE